MGRERETLEGIQVGAGGWGIRWFVALNDRNAWGSTQHLTSGCIRVGWHCMSALRPVNKVTTSSNAVVPQLKLARRMKLLQYK